MALAAIVTSACYVPKLRAEPLVLAPNAQLIGDSENGVGVLDDSIRLMRSMGVEAPDDLDLSVWCLVPLWRLPDFKDFGAVSSERNWEPEKPLSEEEVKPRLNKAQQWRFGEYVLYIWRGEGLRDHGFALYLKGSLAHASEGYFRVTAPHPRKGDTVVRGPAPGRDFDRNGIPDLLLYESSLGAHCCNTVWHIECGARPVVRCILRTWDSEPVFKDLDGDGRPEVILRDPSYAYWNECYAASPFPRVVLHIRSGHYGMAGKLMRAQGPSVGQVARKARRLRSVIEHVHHVGIRIRRGGKPPKWDRLWEDRSFMAWRRDGTSIPSPVWGVMLDLIYSGRCREAIDFVSAVWPRGEEGKEEFIRDVAGQVLTSWFGLRLPWIGDLKKLVDKPFLRGTDLPPLAHGRCLDVAASVSNGSRRGMFSQIKAKPSP